MNKFKSTEQLLIDKISKQFEVQFNLIWGNLVEKIHTKILEQIFDTKIFDITSISSKYPDLHKYSPDGLCVIDSEIIKKMIESNMIQIHRDHKNAINDRLQDDHVFVLFE